MAPTSGNNKPAIGTVAPVEVAGVWSHVSTILTFIAALVPIILGVLVQLQELPGLPTNVMAWIAAAVAVLTLIGTVLGKLGYLGTAKITPTAASKLIVSDANNEGE